jgi:hypothetical protein
MRNSVFLAAVCSLLILNQAQGRPLQKQERGLSRWALPGARPLGQAGLNLQTYLSLMERPMSSMLATGLLADWQSSSSISDRSARFL